MIGGLYLAFLRLDTKFNNNRIAKFISINHTNL